MAPVGGLGALPGRVTRRAKQVSLRARLLLGLIAIAAVGLVVADVVIYNEISTYLTGQVDQQLQRALTPLQAAVQGGGGPLGGISPFGANTPPGTYGTVVSKDGQIDYHTFRGNLIGPSPVITSADVRMVTKGLSLQQVIADDVPPPYYFSTHGVGSDFSYRVIGVPGTVTDADGTVELVAAFVATPSKALDATLAQLVRIDLIASAAVLAALALIGYAVVRVGMRPLREIEATAAEIAGGDLSRRVEDDDPRTEVGRLGRSLNVMLGHIEYAFAEQQASEAQLRQFLADASHELRTPVTSIRGYSELFRRGAIPEGEETAAAMRRIEEEATRMGVLVEDLLLLARLDQGRPLEQFPVDFAALAIDAAADAQARAPERPILVEAPEPVLVTGDEQRLRQVVGNLVQNALVHTPEATPITVSVQTVGDRAVLSVRDEGPGIAPEHLERIFERFYRVDPSRSRASGGAGLGLSIVASIAEAHGGRARVETSPGEGATFLVELPLRPAEAEAAGDEHSLAHPDSADYRVDLGQESGETSPAAGNGAVAPVDEVRAPG